MICCVGGVEVYGGGYGEDGEGGEEVWGGECVGEEFGGVGGWDWGVEEEGWGGGEEVGGGLWRGGVRGLMCLRILYGVWCYLVLVCLRVDI